MKTQLTIEQSERLIELGVSPERASMRESSVAYGNGARGIMKAPETPIFTLADLLDILPKEINRERIEIGYDCDGWYGEYNNLTLRGSCSFAPELIDALYSLLLWCLEKGYVK